DLQKTNTTIGAFNVEGNDDVGGEILKAKEEIAQPEPPKEEETKVFDVVEEMPSFPGGQGALMEYLQKNIKYPVVAAENGIEGRVIVRFVVSKDGSISNVTVVRSVDSALDKEAIRVVESMPKWIPGKQNGASVNVNFTLPVTFKLQ
ncbi:MAG: energy transducer TonB, partial [Prevotella sp.]|nr:energy transducer TonB [Prevotella sp.]